jgi:hypothetical protein
MIISASALKRHQPYDQRTFADILLISPRAFEQSAIHFAKKYSTKSIFFKD